jgi:hypothetical protein
MSHVLKHRLHRPRAILLVGTKLYYAHCLFPRETSRWGQRRKSAAWERQSAYANVASISMLRRNSMFCGRIQKKLIKYISRFCSNGLFFWKYYSRVYRTLEAETVTTPLLIPGKIPKGHSLYHMTHCALPKYFLSHTQWLWNAIGIWSLRSLRVDNLCLRTPV